MTDTSKDYDIFKKRGEAKDALDKIDEEIKIRYNNNPDNYTSTLVIFIVVIGMLLAVYSGAYIATNNILDKVF